MTKQYDNDFKLNTVKLVVEEGKPASQVARDLGITPIAGFLNIKMTPNIRLSAVGT